MTVDEVAEMKPKESLLRAMRRNRGTGVRVTIESFVAAAELVKHDQAECYRAGRPLYIRELVKSL
jgi:molybdate-binding protein